MFNSNIKDTGEFIFFSKNTVGLSGKPVKINTNLLTNFILSVDPTTATGQSIIREIESLKALAKSTGVQPNDRIRTPDYDKLHEKRLVALNNHLINSVKTFENAFVSNNVRIYYHIGQQSVDKTKTVYINDIQFIGISGGKGGLYDLKASRIDSEPKKVDTLNLDNKTVFISGLSKSIVDCKEDALKRDPACSAVFYTPDSLSNDLSLGTKNRESAEFKNLTKELQSIVSHNQSKKVNWIIEGEGAALVQKMLATSPNRGPLSSHTVTLVNPIGDIPKLLNDLKQRKANIPAESVLKIDHDFSNSSKSLSNYASVISIASQGKQLVDALYRLPTTPTDCFGISLSRGFDKGGTISRIEKISKFDTHFQDITSAGSNHKGSSKTFVEALNYLRTKVMNFKK